MKWTATDCQIAGLFDCWTVGLSETSDWIVESPDWLGYNITNTYQGQQSTVWFVIFCFCFQLNQNQKTVHGFPFKNYISKPRVDVAVIKQRLLLFLLLSFVSGFSISEFKVLMDNFLANHLLRCTCIFGHLAMIDCCQMIIATATATQY